MNPRLMRAALLVSLVPDLPKMIEKAKCCVSGKTAETCNGSWTMDAQTLRSYNP